MLYAIRQYRQELSKIQHFGGTRNEGSIRRAFAGLLSQYASAQQLVLVEELSMKTSKGNTIRFDGVLKDILRLDWGYWEAKDEKDNLDDEIDSKFAKGYPKDNILFEDSQVAVLIQEGEEVLRVSMDDEKQLDKLLQRFISYERPEVQNFRVAIEAFRTDIPKVTEALREQIQQQEQRNPKFKAARNEFWELCQQSINPDISKEDIQEMMIQHILTEDIFNTIFDETQFHRENNIARELEKVVNTFFVKEVKRETLGKIQHYYLTIKAAAANIHDHHEKQKFLKVIYENFYKAYNPKGADRLGIVYTPNEIVKFMIESTDYLLHKHFDKYLEDKGVEILDPAVGTGTYICDILDFIRKEKLEYKYKYEIHANEVAILPYYIANLNIEYTYKQKMGKYAEFENLCFVDTLDNVGFSFKGKQTDLFGVSAENAERIKRQNERKISVIIGNPPYNAKQENYNYQNANKAYKSIDERIKNTYIKEGTAQNQIGLYDMYVRFFRWAMDRLGNEGIITFITNNSFINARTFDGFRKYIHHNFSFAYIIDLGGNIRELSGKDGIFLNEKHTIFGKAAAVGIAILFLIKKSNTDESKCRIHYIHPTDIRATRDEKVAYLTEHSFKDIPFEIIRPDKNANWINQTDNDFGDLLPLIDKDVKAGKKEEAIFMLFSSGVKSQRDEWVYDYSKQNLENKMRFFAEVYQKTVENPNYDDKFLIKWDADLESYLSRKIEKVFDDKQVISSLYRPYSKQFFYFDRHFNGRTYQWFNIYQPNINKIIAIPGLSSPKDFFCLCFDTIIDLNAMPAGGQNIPMYYYENGQEVENITDWALAQFSAYYLPFDAKNGGGGGYGVMENYKNGKIDKSDIFHYIYAVLHNPAYRKKYELNLKREFPRIPFYEDFWKWSDWGKKLADLHINYETVEKYPLVLEQRIVPEGKHEKALLRADKLNGTIHLTDHCCLKGIPAEAWDYKLGNRSALEWILNQYKESKPSDKTIAEKFNTYRFADYKEQVIDLLMRVCTVSVETVAMVREMLIE